MEFAWHAQPDFESLTLDGAPGLRARVGQIDDRLESAMAGAPVTVTTSLPDIVATAERSLLASRTGVLLLTVQFVVLAAYAVLLSAALLVEHRRVDTAMLRSRGAGPVRIAGLSLVEGLLLTVPATLLAPWLAAAALGAFNVAGPLADIGLRIQPVVSGEAYLAAAAGAAVCLIALLLPALPTVRSFASVHGSVARAETRPSARAWASTWPCWPSPRSGCGSSGTTGRRSRAPSRARSGSTRSSSRRRRSASSPAPSLRCGWSRSWPR